MIAFSYSRIWTDWWTGMVEGLPLDFNVEKCKTMRIKHSFQTEYGLNGIKLQEVAEKS